MTSPGNDQIKKLYRFRWLLVSAWTVIVLALTGWMIAQQDASVRALNLAHARAHFEKDVAYRRWNAARGGVYAKVDELTPPNPYLKVPHRDIETTAGQQLTLINPAYMTRQVHELVASGGGVRGHITSLDPIRPENAADPWETRALRLFEQGVEEVSGLGEIDGKTYLRLMRPLTTEKVCLKCHEKQGYKLGDVRGGISVSIPHAPIVAARSAQRLKLGMANSAVWLMGVLGVVLGTRALAKGVRRRDQVEDDLRHSEAALNSIVSAAPVGIGLVQNRVIKRANRLMAEITGYEADEIIDRNARFLYLSDEDYERVGRVKYEQIRRCGIGIAETRFRRKDGAIIDVLISSSPLDTSDLAKGVSFTVQDITERKRGEDKLREAAAVFASTAEGVTITDTDGGIRDVNQAFCDITGYDRVEVLGQNPRVLQSGSHDRAFYEAMWRSLSETGQWRGEIWNRRKDGTVYPELLTISAVYDRGARRTGYVGVFTDITALKQSEERLDYLAHHDALTGLPNRLLFNERLRHSIHHAAHRNDMLGLLFIDLDRFKNVNDSLGHPIGDQLLQQFARRLEQLVSDDDTVARLSGDEFVVLLEHVLSSDMVATLAGKLMEALKRPFAIGESEVRVSASIGISLYPDDGHEGAGLMRNADAAMYRAKDEGRNAYRFYSEEMTVAAFEHVFLENALRGALDQGELRLVYQPQVDLVTGRWLGLEALLRWHHPQQGVIPPARFIPIAEQSGLIRDIGRWVLQRACVQGKRWLEEGFALGRIAVNVAGAQLHAHDFAATVEQVLKETGLPPESLELEVCEDFVMRRPDVGVDQLQTLQAQGISIAIDDFGTGYSSLGHLKRLPIDKLKIDRTFVRDIPEDADDVAICSAIIAISKALGIDIIAEGVETESQAEFLRHLGCESAQGFLFARPMPPERIESLWSGIDASPS